jgi:hypothetical protein
MSHIKGTLLISVVDGLLASRADPSRHDAQSPQPRHGAQQSRKSLWQLFEAIFGVLCRLPPRTGLVEIDYLTAGQCRQMPTGHHGISSTTPEYAALITAFHLS